jgi:hypothetical protein
VDTKQNQAVEAAEEWEKGERQYASSWVSIADDSWKGVWDGNCSDTWCEGLRGNKAHCSGYKARERFAELLGSRSFKLLISCVACKKMTVYNLRCYGSLFCCVCAMYTSVRRPSLNLSITNPKLKQK